MVLSDHVSDLLSHIALRPLKIIEPYLVEQERMANAQLLMYGSKHLEQNFFFFNHPWPARICRRCVRAPQGA